MKGERRLDYPNAPKMTIPGNGEKNKKTKKEIQISAASRLQLFLVGLAQGSVDLPIDGRGEQRRHGVADLSTSLASGELKVKRECLETCELASRELAPAVRMEVVLSATAGDGFRWRVRRIRLAVA